jgi:bifunctional DNase/RNase
MANIFEVADLTMTAVHITELKDGIFYAEIQIRDSQSALLKVSARPSDAIAVALRTKSNILADSDLLDQVGIDIPERLADGQDLLAGDQAAGSDQDLERFREFLDQINPEDFAG